MLKLLQSCPTLCGSMDCSPPDSSVCGIFLTRILEQVAISSSRGSSRPRDQTCISYVSCGRRVLYHQRHLGSPLYTHTLFKRTTYSVSPSQHTVGKWAFIWQFIKKLYTHFQDQMHVKFLECHRCGSVSKKKLFLIKIYSPVPN